MNQKNTARLLIILLIMLLTGIALIHVNRDIFQYQFDIRLDRSFVPERDSHRDYILWGPITLKPGSYELSFVMTVEGRGSGVYMIDGDEEIFFTSDLLDGMENPSFPFEISGGMKQVRVGISYDPQTSSISMNRMRISSDHVLYRDSITRHAVISLLILLCGLWLILRLCYPNLLWKLFPAFAKPENELALVLLILLTAASSWPLFDMSAYVRGEDTFFHLTRIRGLADSLQAGYFPVRDQLYWLHDYGYGVGFYYPDVFLYFPALLMLFGFDELSKDPSTAYRRDHEFAFNHLLPVHLVKKPYIMILLTLIVSIKCFIRKFSSSLIYNILIEENT